MRRVLAGWPSVGGGMSSCHQTRSVVVFSEQSKKLVAAQKTNNYRTNVWIEKSDCNEYVETCPKDGEQPVEIVAEKRLELFNISQVEAFQGKQIQDPVSNIHAYSHQYSYKTGELYTGSIHVDLEKVKRRNRYESYHWISAPEMRQCNLRPLPGQQPTVCLTSVPLQVYNADQMLHPEVLTTQPFSAASKKPFLGAIRDQLMAHRKEHCFPTAVYISATHLRHFNVGRAPNTDGVAITSKVQPMPLYNIGQLGPSALQAIAEMEIRVAQDTHCMLPSGQPLVGLVEELRALETLWAEKGFTQRQWFSVDHVKRFQLELLRGEEPVEVMLTPHNKPSVLYLNAHQTTHPNAVLENAGLLQRVR